MRHYGFTLILVPEVSTARICDMAFIYPGYVLVPHGAETHGPGQTRAFRPPEFI
jgi:hypothetical protein